MSFERGKPYSKHILIISFFSVIVFFCIRLNYPSLNELLCKDRKDSMECLSIQLQTNYRANYKEFFVNLNKFSDQKVVCQDNAQSVYSLLKYLKGNVELEEYFAEKVETLVITNPKCAIDNFYKIDNVSQKIYLSFITHPLTSEPEKLKSSLETQKGSKRYNDFIKLIEQK